MSPLSRFESHSSLVYWGEDKEVGSGMTLAEITRRSQIFCFPYGILMKKS